MQLRLYEVHRLTGLFTLFLQLATRMLATGLKQCSTLTTTLPLGEKLKNSSLGKLASLREKAQLLKMGDLQQNWVPAWSAHSEGTA